MASFLMVYLLRNFVKGIKIGSAIVILFHLGIVMYKLVKKWLLARHHCQFLENVSTTFKEKESDDNCIICMDVMGNGKELPCGHFFHFGCLISWIEKNKFTCPICRASVHTNRHVNSVRVELNLETLVRSEVSHLSRFLEGFVMAFYYTGGI